MAFWSDIKESVGSSKQLSLYADTDSDIANLPTDPDEVAPGSTCMVISSATVYMLDSSYTWTPIGGA